MTAAQPGVCRYCKCTERGRCRLPDGDPCGWFDPARTVCSAPACLTAHFAARDKAGLDAYRARPKKRTPAEIHALMQAEKKARRRGARPRRTA